MKYISGITLIALIAVGCDDGGRNTSNATSNGTVVDRNNSAVNMRDRDGTTKTAFDQNENKKDIEITANIRKQVVDTKMSVDAQNVKIITQDGRVTHLTATYAKSASINRSPSDASGGSTVLERCFRPNKSDGEQSAMQT